MAIRRPTVSVIIPTYNRAEMLRLAVESVFAQTYRPVQVIVVDDGSTDDTVQTLSSLQRDGSATNCELIVLRQENRGVSAARNAGIRAATGEFVLFLDSDDSLDARTCDLLVSEIGDNDICVGGYQSVGGGDVRPQFLPDMPGSEDPLDDYLQEKLPCFHVWLARLEVVKRSPLFPEHVSFTEDSIHCFRLLQNARGVSRVREPLYQYRQHHSDRVTDVHVHMTKKARLNLAEFYGEVAESLLRQNRGTIETRTYVASQMLLIAILTWPIDRKLGRNLVTQARRLSPDAQPRLRRCGSRMLWRLGGLTLCGMTRSILDYAGACISR